MHEFRCSAMHLRFLYSLVLLKLLDFVIASFIKTFELGLDLRNGIILCILEIVYSLNDFESSSVCN